LRAQALPRQARCTWRRGLARLEKEPSTFSWTYGESETCYVVRGRFTVTPDGGEPHAFSRGDLITFPAGLSCTWEITEAVEKHFTLG